MSENNDTSDSAPLPSEPVLTEEETLRQLNADREKYIRADERSKIAAMSQGRKDEPDPLPELTEKTERFLERFTDGGGSIYDVCGCGRHHVFTHNNKGSFDPGELESYEAKAKVEPGKWFFHDYSGSSRGWVAGHKFVLDCTCLENRFARYANFVWDNRDQILNFLQKQIKAVKDSVAQAEQHLEEIKETVNE